jgi:hypothetical protein
MSPKDLNFDQRMLNNNRLQLWDNNPLRVADNLESLCPLGNGIKIERKVNKEKEMCRMYI